MSLKNGVGKNVLHIAAARGNAFSETDSNIYH
jgi:hypothetical protein